MNHSLQHLNFSHDVFHAPKVSSHQNKYDVALAAVRNINGAHDVVHSEFNKSRPVNIAFEHKPEPVVNLKMVHIVGERNP